MVFVAKAAANAIPASSLIASLYCNLVGKFDVIEGDCKFERDREDIGDAR